MREARQKYIYAFTRWLCVESIDHESLILSLGTLLSVLGDTLTTTSIYSVLNLREENKDASNAFLREGLKQCDINSSVVRFHCACSICDLCK